MDYLKGTDKYSSSISSVSNISFPISTVPSSLYYSVPCIYDGIDYSDYATYKSTHQYDMKVAHKSAWNWIPGIKGIYPQEKKRMVVVKFMDNSIVKLNCHPEDQFDVGVAVAYAIAYKLYGSKGAFKREIEKVTKGDK